MVDKQDNSANIYGGQTRQVLISMVDKQDNSANIYGGQTRQQC